MTLAKVIANLPDTDARKGFWQRIQSLINAGDYGLACQLVHYQKDDVDYATQCEVMVDAIARHHDGQVI